MRQKSLIFYPVLWMLLCTTMVKGQNSDSTVLKKQLYSKILKENRDYWIALPKDYNSAATYPVIYVFDAEKYFDLVMTVVKDRVKYGKLCPYIIVGIPNRSQESRTKDLTFSASAVGQTGELLDTKRYTKENTGGGFSFLEFLTSELVPEINKNYRTGKNVLLGHSFSAYFGLYISSMQEIFDTYILLEPSIWYSEGESLLKLKEEKDFFRRNPEKSFFIGYQSSPLNHKKGIQELIAFFKKENINFRTQEFQDENHGSVYLPAIISAMEFISTGKCERKHSRRPKSKHH